MAQPTAVTIPSRLATAPVEFGFTAGTTSPTLITWMPGDILLVFNSHADTAKTITIISNTKRSLDTLTISAFSIPAQDYYVCPRFGPQDADVLSVACESTDILLARISTAAQPS